MIMSSNDAIPESMDVYKLVLKAIRSGNYDETSEDLLVEETQKKYLSALELFGVTVPKDDYSLVEQEIRDTIKAITYGYFSIKDFNKSKKTKN